MGRPCKSPKEVPSHLELPPLEQPVSSIMETQEEDCDPEATPTQRYL